MTVKVNPNLMNQLREAAARGVFAGANLVRDEALRLVNETPKTGTTVRRRGIFHKRSAPGEPYASDTGNTVGAITEPVVSDDGLTATVYFRGENAKRMEFGTENMEPRPVAAPALRNKSDEAKELILGELRAVLDK